MSEGQNIASGHIGTRGLLEVHDWVNRTLSLVRVQSGLRKALNMWSPNGLRRALRMLRLNHWQSRALRMLRTHHNLRSSLGLTGLHHHLGRARSLKGPNHQLRAIGAECQTVIVATILSGIVAA